MKRIKAAVTEDAQPDGSLRVRLELTFRGHLDITTTPFAPLGEDTVWRVRIAATTMPSDDPIYRHKTTRREVYDKARAEFSTDEADEVILLNERGEVCEGTITNLFIKDKDGRLSTPPISCGLLAGILRADLIREGRAKSTLVKRDDLTTGTLYVGNSLRGLIRAELAEG
jgi:4-amino-4-deoxychorismate lyase